MEEDNIELESQEAVTRITIRPPSRTPSGPLQREGDGMDFLAPESKPRPTTWENDEFERFDLEADAEVSAQAPELDRQAELANQRSLTADIGLAIARTPVGVAENLFNSLTDIGIVSGAWLGEQAGDALDLEIDSGKSVKQAQDIRDKTVSFFTGMIPEPDREWVRIGEELGTSLATFAGAWTKLPSQLTRMQKAAAAGGVEGFLDDINQETMVVEDAIRSAANAIGGEVRNAVADMLDIDSRTPESVMVRRLLSATEVSLMSLAGERLGVVAEKRMPEFAKKVGDMISSQAMTMRRAKQAAIQYLDRGAKKVDAKKIKIDDAADYAFAYKGGVDVNKTLADQVTDVFGTSMPFDGRIADEKSYNKAMKQLMDGVKKQVPNLAADVIKMAKARGISEKEAFAKLIGKAGDDFTERSFRKGVEDVLIGQASNILLEGQAAKLERALNAYDMLAKAGDATSIPAATKKAVDALEDFLYAAQQWQSQATAAGRALRVQGELGQVARSTKEALENTPIVRDVMKWRDEKIAREADSITDGIATMVAELRSGSARDLLPEMMNIMKAHGLQGKTSEDLAKNVLKGIADDNSGRASRVLKTIEQTFVAGLLTGIPTLTQNQFSSYVQMTVKASESAVEAVVAKILRPSGRTVEGTPTVTGAFRRLMATQTMHFEAMAMTATAIVKAVGKRDIRELGKIYDSNFFDVPQMQKRDRDAMLRMNKEDASRKGGTLIQYDENGSPEATVDALLHWGTGQPIYDVIAFQDRITKSVGARAFIQEASHTAIYGDDVLGLNKMFADAATKDDGMKLAKKAKDLFFKMSNNPTETNPTDIAKYLGVSESKAKILVSRFRKVREDWSEAAAKSAIDDAFQTNIKELESLRYYLQDALPLSRMWLATFFMTPANIVNETLKRAPLLPVGEAGVGLPIHPSFYKDFMAGGRRRQQALSRFVVGNSIFAMGMAGHEDGAIQFVPASIDHRRFLENQFNIAPGSVIINGTSYPVQALGPVGMMAVTGASFQAFINERKELSHLTDEEISVIKDSLVHSITNFTETFKEHPMASWIDRTHRVLFGGERGMEQGIREASDIIGTTVPYSSAVRQWSPLFDDYKRTMLSISDRLTKLWPNEKAQAVDVFSRPIEAEQMILTRGKKIRDDEVSARMMASGFYPRPASRGIMYDGVELELNIQQFQRYNEIMRTQVQLYEAVKYLVNRPEYEANIVSQDFEANQRALQGVFRSSQNEAASILVMENRELMGQFNKNRGLIQSEKKVTPQNKVAVPSFSGGR